MRLIEHDGKRLLARHGIAVPGARLVESDAAFPGGACVLKAQITEGGRGKAGLILRADAENGAAQLELLRERMRARGDEPLVLAEDLAPPEYEFYVAIRIDGARQCAMLMVGREGGMDVESAAPPLQVPIDPLRGLYPHTLLAPLREAGFPARLIGPLARFACSLHRVFVAEDAELIEINPLAVTADGRLLALDCKMELDDSAAFRHADRAALRSARLSASGVTALERRGESERLSFVELPGNVAVLTSGAGLGMAVVDALRDVGLAPANFIDSPAGMSLEAKIDLVFERARDPEVKAIAIYFLQTAQPLRRTMGRLFELLDRAPAPKPLAIGVMAAAGGERGMSMREATEELKRRGYETAETFAELAAAARRLVQKSPA